MMNNKSMNDELIVHLDAASAHIIGGWAWIPSDYSKKLQIRLLGDDGVVLHSANADIFRQDLLDAGIGDGAHGFMFKGYFSGWVKEIIFLGEGVFKTIPVDLNNASEDEFLCVHHDDFMLKHIEVHPEFAHSLGAALAYYVKDAKDSADKLSKLCEGYFDKHSKLNLLEFAAGYGRVTRYLDRERFDITACDIHREAIQYIRDNIKVNTLTSATCPEDFRSDSRYDVVFALSFFTHLPDKTFGKWMRALYEQVSSGGLLIFTTHGRCMADHEYFKDIVHEGYAFVRVSEQGDLSTEDYGSTLSLYEYVEKICKEYINTSPVEWHEGFWHSNIQDVYIIKKDV